MKKIIAFCFASIICGFLYAGTKISDLQEDAPTSDDLTVIVDSPGSSPVTKKITIGSLGVVGQFILETATGTRRSYQVSVDSDGARGVLLKQIDDAAQSGDTIWVKRGKNIHLGQAQIGKSGVRYEIDPRVIIISSHTYGYHSSSGSWNYPYVYNADRGLKNWFVSLGQVSRVPITNLGGGGIDIVTLGHSRMEHGYGHCGPNCDGATPAETYHGWLTNRWTHILKVMLQDKYNPKGVKGGFGYVPCYAGSQSISGGVAAHARNMIQFGGTGAVTVSSSNFQSHLGATFTMAAGNSSVYFPVDGGGSVDSTTATFRRMQAKSVALSFTAGSGLGIARVYLSTGAQVGVPIANWIASATVNMANGSTIISSHSIQLFEGIMVSTANNYITVFADGSGGGDIRLDGLFLFNDDAYSGIRLHDVSRWGISISGWADNHWDGVERFFSAATSQTSDNRSYGYHGKLAIMDHIGADFLNWSSPSSTETFRQEIITNLNTYVMNEPSAPSVLWVIPPHFDNDNTRERYGYYREAIYKAADEKGFAIIDMERMLNGCGLDTCGWCSFGACGDDTRHDTLIGQKIYAEEVLKVLTGANH